MVLFYIVVYGLLLLLKYDMWRHGLAKKGNWKSSARTAVKFIRLL